MLNPQRNAHSLYLKTVPFKRAIRTLVRLWCHNYTITGKTAAKLCVVDTPRIPSCSDAVKIQVWTWKWSWYVPFNNVFRKTAAHQRVQIGKIEHIGVLTKPVVYCSDRQSSNLTFLIATHVNQRFPVGLLTDWTDTELRLTLPRRLYGIGKTVNIFGAPFPDSDQPASVKSLRKELSLFQTNLLVQHLIQIFNSCSEQPHWKVEWKACHLPELRPTNLYQMKLLERELLDDPTSTLFEADWGQIIINAELSGGCCSVVNSAAV